LAFELEEVVVDELVEVLDVVLVELELEPVKWPTTMVTVLLLVTLLPPDGLCEMTVPSWFWLVTSLVLRATLNPAACSALAAPLAGSPTTGGTVLVVGADATTIVTVVPTGSLVPALGLWLMTLPAVVVVDVWVLADTLKPAFSSA
jgi:hypothetical protein